MKLRKVGFDEVCSTLSMEWYCEHELKKVFLKFGHLSLYLSRGGLGMTPDRHRAEILKLRDAFDYSMTHRFRDRIEYVFLDYINFRC